LLCQCRAGREVVDPDARKRILRAPQVIEGKDQIERGRRTELACGGIRCGGAVGAWQRRRGRRLAEREAGLIDPANRDDHSPTLRFQIPLVELQLPQRTPQRQLDPILILDLLPPHLLVVEDRLAEVVSFGESGERGVELHACREGACGRAELGGIVADGADVTGDDDIEPGQE